MADPPTGASSSRALLLAAVLLSGCATVPLGPERASTGPITGPLRATDDGYVLEHPFEDFYDTAFVLTDAGSARPRVLTLAQLASVLAAYDIVFYGESHTHPGVHLQQMNLLRALVNRDPYWVLSFEQFERDVQSVLDDYVAGRIGETALIDKGRAWKNYATSYRPLLLFAKDHHLPVIAAEAPDWTVTCVGRWGPAILDRFTPLERTWVAAELHTAPGAYRDKFAAFLGSSPTHGGAADSLDSAARADRSFAAQVTRDDTMAESIDAALRAHPRYRVLHLTGSFHSAAFLGTVERLRLRDAALKIAVIDPIEVADPNAPAFTVDDARGGTVLQLIEPTPEPFVEGEDMSSWSAKMTHAHDSAHCPYSLDPAAAPAT